MKIKNNCKQSTLALFESHQDGNKGGLVLLCNLEEFDLMLNYLEKSQNLCGSNFAEHGLTKCVFNDRCINVCRVYIT